MLNVTELHPVTTSGGHPRRAVVDGETVLYRAKRIKAPAKDIPAARPRKRQDCAGIEIDLANRELVRLMIEHFRGDAGYVTVYSATGQELLAAGVPSTAFPRSGATTSKFSVRTLNACCTGNREHFQGSMHTTAQGYELVIHWGYVHPHTQASHPIVEELARLVLIDIQRYRDFDPREVLRIDEVATYWNLPSTPRLKFTPEFLERLQNIANQAYELVFEHCEVVADESESQEPRLRLVTNRELDARA